MNTFMRFPGGRCKALTLSFDDGVDQDIRLIEIMQQHGLKGTFNLNSGIFTEEGTVFPEGCTRRRLTKQQATRLYKDSGMEVAVHSLKHPFLDQLPINLCLNEIAKDRENLEEQFDTMVRGMAYPMGTYDDKVIQCLKCAGIVYARTVISTGDFRIPEDWYRLTATCHYRDQRLMELSQTFVEKTTNRVPWLFYVWGHSYEFDERNNWDVIERFAEYIGGKDDIWYATNMEIYEYIEAYKKLVFSMDGHRVFNPAACTIYFLTDEKLHCVKPGEMIWM